MEGEILTIAKRSLSELTDEELKSLLTMNASNAARHYGLTKSQIFGYRNRVKIHGEGYRPSTKHFTAGKTKFKFKKVNKTSDIFAIKLGNIAIRIENNGTKVSEIVTDDEQLTIKVSVK